MYNTVLQPHRHTHTGGHSCEVHPHMQAQYAQSPLQTCATQSPPQSYAAQAQAQAQAMAHHYATPSVAQSFAIPSMAHHYATPPTAQIYGAESPGQPYANTCVDPALTSKIAQAIDGEYTAICCYAQLIAQAPTDEERRQINEIRNDEIRHYQVFSQIYSSMTERCHQAQMNGQCPPRYTDGILAAFQDEQKTVDFYLELADSAQDPYTKEQFKRAAADEQNHAVWFLSLIMKNCFTPMPCCNT